MGSNVKTILLSLKGDKLKIAGDKLKGDKFKISDWQCV